MNRQSKAKPRNSILRRAKWWLRARWRWFKGLKAWQKITLISVPVLLVLVVIPILIFAYFAATMGDMENLMNRNNTGVVLKDVSGETFYSTGTAEHRELVKLDAISDYVEQALVASEDKNFYTHGGVSVLSTLRAVYGYVFSRSGEFGGSTITQQLAKMTLLSNNRSFMRQYQALSVAIAIEQRYSKDEILEMYLNSAFFGNSSFGIEQAAKNYFNKKPNELTLAESALLIGLLPAPSTYSPITGDAALGVERQHEVLSRMVRENMITEAERTTAQQEVLAYQAPATIDNIAPHFTEMVLSELYDKYGEEIVERSGYQVTTTLDLTLQRQANANVASRVAYIQSMGGSNAGLIAIDPKTGEIRALVGSVDYANEIWGKVNMATTARQPGSSFKPLYYSYALADGVITPATIIKDEAININGYAPQNATKRYYGNVTVRQALARSLNIPAVKVMQQYGIDKSIAAAKSLGVTTLKNEADYGLSLAIGSAEVPLQQITNAYAAFANAGQQYGNTTLHSIKDKFDKTLYENKHTSKQAISAQGAYLISSILSDASARSYMFGSSLTVAGGKTVAVKTGTTDENRDAWAVGYTPDIAIGVWVGNNDNAVMTSGGADMAGPIWKATMTQAIGTGTPSFAVPEGVVQRAVCYGNGGLAVTASSATYNEYFLVSALPTTSCTAAPTTTTDDTKQTETPEETTTIQTPETSGSGDGSSGGNTSTPGSSGSGTGQGGETTTPGTSSGTTTPSTGSGSSGMGATNP